MDIAVVILAAGKGTRMKSSLPKVMHPVAGRPMVHRVLDAAQSLSPSQIIVVVGPGMEPLERSIALTCPTARCVVQEKQLGTADAVKVALPTLKILPDKLLVLYADTPLITASTLKKMASNDAAVTVLGFTPKDPAEYGRLVTDGNGELHSIVEFRDANAQQRTIGLCNSGVIAIKGALLHSLLNQVKNDNAKGEYYLTDIIALARKENHPCRVVMAEEEEVFGINSRTQLAEAEHIVQNQLRSFAMENGATLIQPETVTFCFDTIVGQDVTIHPYVVFGRHVRVENAVEIRSFSHIEGATLKVGSVVGPFARLRPGTVVGREAKIGNFVEIKNTTLQEGAKVNHLSYIGDADVGQNANIGAGTITCNYDGFHKHRTVIGSNTLIGSNTALVAPVSIGNGAIIGAGSVIVNDVSDNALSLARSTQVILEGKGATIRKRKEGKEEE